LLKRLRKQELGHSVLSELEVKDAEVIEVVLRMWLLALLVDLVELRKLISLADVKAGFVCLGCVLYYSLAVAVFLDDK
jgi:hypothetical protein